MHQVQQQCLQGIYVDTEGSNIDTRKANADMRDENGGADGARFIPIKAVDELEQWLQRSEEDTVVLFNHDPWCPISARALAEVEEVQADIALIDVARERSVTREIAQRTGIRHESPQVIVLRHGAPVWSASHYSITTDAVEQALGASAS